METIDFQQEKKKPWRCDNPDHTWCPRRPNLITKKMIKQLKLKAV